MPEIKLLPGLPNVTADVNIGIGDGFWPPIEEISSADQTTVIGDGTTRRPLHGSGGPGGEIQAFQIALTGAEDIDNIPVTLNTPLPTANYAVAYMANILDVNNEYEVLLLKGTKTINGFSIALTGAATNGDTIDFTVTPYT